MSDIDFDEDPSGDPNPAPCDLCSRPVVFRLRVGQETMQLCEVHAQGQPGRVPMNSAFDVSVNRFGRALFGLLSLVCAVFFGGMVFLLCWKGQPQAVWKQIMWHVLVDVFMLLAVFMLVTTAHFWAIGGRLTEKLLEKIGVKAGIALMVLVIWLLALATMHIVMGR